ncbi:RNA-directed DNA polymerase, eukaryota [Tanacetum coccineum]
MEAIRRNFFNGAQDNDKKITWVKWVKVLSAKKYGGLAIHGPNIQKLSCFNSSIWNNILKEVNILKGRGVDLISHCKRRVGNGMHTRFWSNVWLGDQQLRYMFPRIYALEENKECSVAVKLQGDDLIGSSVLVNAEDRWFWDLNGNGVFFVKDVRKLLDESFLPKEATATRWIKFVPIKINVFAWKVSLDRLPTRVNLMHRGIYVSSLSCPICSSHIEDTSHLLFSCTMATDVTRLVCRWWDLVWSPLGSYSEWLSWFNSIRLGSNLKTMLEGVFFVTWWCLWNFRNRFLFAAQKPRKDVHSSLYDLHMTNTNMSIKFSVVHREIDEILGSYAWGIAMSRLSWLEREPEKEEKYVMSARLVEIKKDFLKLNVQKLLDENRGEIILQRYSGGGSSKLRREGDKGGGQTIQFKQKKEDMNETIEGCRRYEEDDHILFSLWLKATDLDIMNTLGGEHFLPPLSKFVERLHQVLIDMIWICECATGEKGMRPAVAASTTTCCPTKLWSISHNTISQPQRYSGGGSSKLRREGDKGRGQDLQFKKKEDMDEKIEGCRTYEEDDDILLSLWLTEFLVLTVHRRVEETSEFAKIIPNHKLHIVEGANHGFSKHQDELISVVLSFIKET